MTTFDIITQSLIRTERSIKEQMNDRTETLATNGLVLVCLQLIVYQFNFDCMLDSSDQGLWWLYLASKLENFIPNFTKNSSRVQASSLLTRDDFLGYILSCLKVWDKWQYYMLVWINICASQTSQALDSLLKNHVRKESFTVIVIIKVSKHFQHFDNNNWYTNTNYRIIYLFEW